MFPPSFFGKFAKEVWTIRIRFKIARNIGRRG